MINYLVLFSIRIPRHHLVSSFMFYWIIFVLNKWSIKNGETNIPILNNGTTQLASWFDTVNWHAVVYGVREWVVELLLIVVVHVVLSYWIWLQLTSLETRRFHFKMPGFECRFRDRIPRHYACPLCKNPMREPVQITSCGHHFCDTCLQGYLR